MNKLEEICNRKREHIEQQKSKTSLDDLKYKCSDMPPARGFTSALVRKAPDVALIAEVKKASPSKGVIREDFDPVAIAKAYESGGATCLSVLTDEPYFQGNDAYIAQVKDAVNLPVLRKDFILDPYQVYQSRALGADCILLIMAALEDSQAKDLYLRAEELGMDILVEVHTEEELERTVKFDPFLIGINARDLTTLEVNLQTTHDLSAKIPPHAMKVAESGIKNHDDILSLRSSGFQAFLVGETLMAQADIAQATKDLLQK